MSLPRQALLPRRSASTLGTPIAALVRAALRALDDRMRKDLGIGRSEVAAVVHGRHHDSTAHLARSPIDERLSAGSPLRPLADRRELISVDHRRLAIHRSGWRLRCGGMADRDRVPRRKGVHQCLVKLGIELATRRMPLPGP